MNFNILTDYPVWFILLCLLAGAFYAFILYYREKRNEYSLSLRWILSVLRFVAVTLIAFLLLNPLVKSTSNYSEKPVIIFAQDNSSSLVTTPDSAAMKTTYVQNTKQVIDELEEYFEVLTYTFS